MKAAIIGKLLSYNNHLAASKRACRPVMNAVEIEQAVSELCEAPFDRDEFPYQFLEAFGAKQTTIKRLRKGSTNKSEIPGGLLLRNNIHLLGSEPGRAGDDLKRLVASPETMKHKAKFALATDGVWVEAENLVEVEGETLACSLKDLPDHFGFFLSLAGIATVKQIRDNAFDIKATGRMNRLYVELQQNNPDWDTEERREELNHFFARLIFCFFAEDTGIFPQNDIFTGTVLKMSDSDASNTHEIISEVFRAMNIDWHDRGDAGLPRYAASMPYVNGGLFEGSAECPKFTKIARSYFVHIGGLDWAKINPDIFGSMIQAVAEDEERGELGMHYTSVPNILKVLNPLFLDELHQQLEDAVDNKRKLLNLRNRMARIRVFDPACGSGNFLVVAYKEMRGIEAEINRRRGESDRVSDIPLTNFRGIEIRSFAAEVARLALVIAKFQSDLEHRGPQLALSGALPLSKSNWITCGNALRVSWAELCPPTASQSRIAADDLFETPLEQTEVDFENEGGEVFLCGNPPYKGSRRQASSQKNDIEALAEQHIRKWKSLDYVCGWLIKASDYSKTPGVRFAFVCTSSISEGLQVSLLWPRLLGDSLEIFFGHRPFNWSNLAKKSAGVTVVIIGVANSEARLPKAIYSGDEKVTVQAISPYLVPGKTVYVTTDPVGITGRPRMSMGAMPRDGGNLILSATEARELKSSVPQAGQWVRRYLGTTELTQGIVRYCLWLEEDDLEEALACPAIRSRLDEVREFRRNSTLDSTQEYANRPHLFVYLGDQASSQSVIVGGSSSVRREYLPADLLTPGGIVSNSGYRVTASPTWLVSVLSSRMMLTWVAAVCGKLRTDYRFSNTLGWNTFPLPKLTVQDRAELVHCTEDILMTRESYWPATIAHMYDPDRMDSEFPSLREAHEHNDEVLEQIYIGRRFKNDTERLEKLFELYAAATKGEASV